MGPLAGYRIIEIAGIGPGQLCGMLLADMGAQVLRVSRLEDLESGPAIPDRFNLMNRNRTSVRLDLKRREGTEFVLQLCGCADALFEGFRPGVMERLGLGPDACMARNDKLVYGRITGWGQEGPLAAEAGHDTNYLALSGALSSIGERNGPPILPLNLVADFGGGALYLALGLLAAMLEASRSGRGQVVDAAMIDGVASMTTLFHGLMAAGLWHEQRGMNILDGGAPFMRTYATSDGGYVAVAALENRFYRTLLEGLGLVDVDPTRQMQAADWPELQRRFQAVFAARSRAEWEAHFAGRDACVTPVLSLSEAVRHPHNVSRKTFVEVDGIPQPAPAPRFSRTRNAAPTAPGLAGGTVMDVLGSWGVPPEDCEGLARIGALRVD